MLNGIIGGRGWLAKVDGAGVALRELGLKGSLEGE